MGWDGFCMLTLKFETNSIVGSVAFFMVMKLVYKVVYSLVVCGSHVSLSSQACFEMWWMDENIYFLSLSSQACFEMWWMDEKIYFLSLSSQACFEMWWMKIYIFDRFQKNLNTSRAWPKEIKLLQLNLLLLKQVRFRLKILLLFSFQKRNLHTT